jgi:type I restriction-modification system DNA methylase subunit
MKNLNDIYTWKQYFGLLPIHLIPTRRDENSYIMLNGGYGDFCLKTVFEDRKPETYYSLAWSSNTKNFVVLNNDNVVIYNWKKDKTETVPKFQVENNFNKFYTYIVNNSYKTDNDIIPFIIDIFKQFRNLTQEKNNAVEALNLLFYLLAGIEDDISSIDFEKWGLKKISTPNNFDYYLERLKKGIFNLTPKLDLVLRHSSGSLFQEAQKEIVCFDSQLDIWGGLSNKFNIRKNLYSSIHYTPPYLARAIVENALMKLDVSKQSLKILDPACGSSEFLIEVLKQLFEIGYSGQVEINGWDSSETAINTSRFLLTYEKRTIWKERLTFDLKLVSDSLTENWSNNYDIILMNPPFVSWEQLNKESRESVQNVFHKKATGRPNQASAFFYKAVMSLNETGIIGCVIPSSFLLLDSYQNLRNEILENISVDLIGKLGNFIFEDALTDVSFFIGHKTVSTTTPYVLWARNDKGIAQKALRDLRKLNFSNSFKMIDKDFSIYQPTSFPITKENWKPISFSENELFKSIERFVIEKKLCRINEIFNVHQGIRAGNNSIFKLTKDEFKLLPEAEQFLFRPVIDNQSIKYGSFSKENYIWYPYNENGLIIQSEKDLNELANTFYNRILKPNKGILANRKGIAEWWGLTRPRNWQFSKTYKLVSTEFGKSDSFAFDYSGDYVVERGNAWLPKKEFCFNYYYFYLAIFSSNFFNTLLSIYSKQLLAGWDLGKKYTREIPVPNVFLIEVSESPAYNKLVEIGKELSYGQNQLLPLVDDVLQKYFYPSIEAM